jgi:thioredoxin-related protein
MLRESFNHPQRSVWIKANFDGIALSTRGSREVVFNETLTATEKELAQALGVRQTPAMIFLDANNKVVFRSDGYRTPKDLDRLLRYVSSKSYMRMDLSTYIKNSDAGARYKLRNHDLFAKTNNLADTKKPVMVIFEDAYCDGCDLMHDTLLKNAEVLSLMRTMLVVRLDADSDAPLTTPDGTRTNPEAWANALNLNARPGIVLFAGGKEQVRIAGVLRRFHFQTALRYVAEEHHVFHASLREFSRAHRERLLSEGKTIDLGVQ